jgi:hypothetical protein
LLWNFSMVDSMFAHPLAESHHPAQQFTSRLKPALITPTRPILWK